MRVLFASTQGAGHYRPLVAFVDAVQRVGHEALLVVPPALASTVESEGYAFRVGADPPEDEVGAVWSRVLSASTDKELENVLVVGEIFARLNTRAMLPAVREACREWKPDLVLRELSEYSSAIAADELGIPHARVAVGLADSEETYLGIAGPVLDHERPGSRRSIASSPFLTVLPESVDPSPFAPTHRFRDPATAAASRPLPAWWGDDERPLVYVTFGSVAGGLPIAGAAYRAALDAVADLPIRVLLTVGLRSDRATLDPVPENVHVEAWVPQVDVLGEAAAVVGHGGFGTTLGALAAGLPSVVVPLFADQPANARRVEDVGAGLVAAVEATAIRHAIETVLADTSYRDTARRIAAEMRALPPIDELFDALAASSRTAARGSRRV